MTTILILAALFCLYRIFQGLKDRQDERRRQAEMERQRQEATRMREEWKTQQEEYKANLLRQRAILREQEAARKERERLAKEQEKQAKELERHATMLEKHEAQIRKLEFQARQARRDIEFLKERLGQQEAQRDFLLRQQESMKPGAKDYESIQRKVIVLDNQIHSTKRRYNKAVFAAKEAERKVG